MLLKQISISNERLMSNVLYFYIFVYLTDFLLVLFAIFFAISKILTIKKNLNFSIVSYLIVFNLSKCQYFQWIITNYYISSFASKTLFMYDLEAWVRRVLFSYVYSRNRFWLYSSFHPHWKAEHIKRPTFFCDWLSLNTRQWS